MNGGLPAERARRLVVWELKLAARASEAGRRAARRAREADLLPLREVGVRMAGIQRASEMRHLASARVHADHAAWLRGQAGEPDDTGSRVYMSAVASASGTCSAVLALRGVAQPEAIVTPSDSLARAAHDLAATCGEGPAGDAVAKGAPVRAAGGALGATWPLYGPAVERMGIYRVSAAPLRVDGCCLGTVTTLCWNPGGCCPGVPLGWLADALVSALLGRDTTITDDDGLPVALALDGAQAIVHQAAGMVAGRSGADIPAALDMIRARAFAEDERAETIAAQIVGGRLDPGLDN